MGRSVERPCGTFSTTLSSSFPPRIGRISFSSRAALKIVGKEFAVSVMPLSFFHLFCYF